MDVYLALEDSGCRHSCIFVGFCFQRNRRMFGSIMGTLQTFVRDENRGKERDLKKREIEKKIEQV